jgi:hypothetical protein
MGRGKFAFPARAHNRVIGDVRTAAEVRVAFQLQRRVRAHDDAADQVVACGYHHGAAAIRGAGIKRFLKGARIFGFAVSFRAKIAHIQESPTPGCGGNRIGVRRGQREPAQNHREAEDCFANHEM